MNPRYGNSFSYGISKREKVRKVVKEEYQKIKDETVHIATQEALIRCLTITATVLYENFWKSGNRKKFEKFGNLFLEYMQKIEEDDTLYKKWEDDLWEFAGIRFQREY